MKILMLLFFVADYANADSSFYRIDVTQDYACMGYDGIPLGKGTQKASMCCVSSPPKECAAGFNSISGDSVIGANNGLTLAQSSLELESQFDGNTQEYQTHVSNQTDGDSGSESSAMTAGNASDSTASKKGSTKPGAKGLLASSGMGGSASGGAGSGAGLGSALLGSVGDQNGKKGKTGANENDSLDGSEKSKTGGYASAGNAGASAGSSSDGSTGIAVNSDIKNEYSFDANGDGTGKGDLAGNGSGEGDEDGAQKGTAEDPDDYFKRIDKSASIFKIVSSRYLKKKALWIQQPQKKI